MRNVKKYLYIIYGLAFIYGLYEIKEGRYNSDREEGASIAMAAFFLGVITYFITKSNLIKSPVTQLNLSYLPDRFKMLRHTKFYQFPTMNFGQELTPHQFHWRIQEFFEDQGMTDVITIEPTTQVFWSKIAPGESGKEANRADYMPFRGGLRGKFREPVPLWIPILIILSFVFSPFFSYMVDSEMVYFLGELTFLFGLYLIYIWKKFRTGHIDVYYRGTYISPQDGSETPHSHNNWKFSTDMMFSIKIKKPHPKDLIMPFIDKITLQVRSIGNTNTEEETSVYDYDWVETFFNHVKNNLNNSLIPYSLAKEQPELYSNYPKDYEQRFPVKYESTMLKKE